jgi:hypothetical protein
MQQMPKLVFERFFDERMMLALTLELGDNVQSAFIRTADQSETVVDILMENDFPAKVLRREVTKDEAAELKGRMRTWARVELSKDRKQE